MIFKAIITHYDGSKVIRSNIDTSDSGYRIFFGMKKDGKRPLLLQVFTDDTSSDIVTTITRKGRHLVHPVKGRVILNGEFLTCSTK